MAKVQATDDEIMAVLRVEFSAVRPAKIRASELVKRMRDWRPYLEDARVAGRLLPLEALRDAAQGGDVAAATALHKRQELLEGLDPELLRQIKRWMAMEPGQVVTELEGYLAKLRAVG